MAEIVQTVHTGQEVAPAASSAAALVRAERLATLRAAADAHESKSRSDRTRHLYKRDWEHFTAWCRTAGLQHLPAEPETVRLYIEDMALAVHPDGRPVYQTPTMERRLAAITWAHENAKEYPSPARGPHVRNLIVGVKNERRHKPRRMRPLLLEDIRTILGEMPYSTWPQGVAATRDAFVLLMGFVGAFRRSEPASMNHGDITYVPTDGLHTYLEHSKTDQAGEGAVIPLPFGRHPQTCPVCAYIRWARLVQANDEGRPALMRAVLETPAHEDWRHICREGLPQIEASTPLLTAVYPTGIIKPNRISGDALHAIVQRRAAQAGYRTKIGFHSLRAGFVTEARRHGADARSIRRQTRHGADAMIDVYSREYAPLIDNAVTRIGL